MGEWADLIWFVVWSAVILVGIALIIWGSVMAVALKAAKAARADFDKGFDSDFFKKHR